MIKTDVIIIGAGPVGLFTVFEAGLMNLRCHLIDSLPYPGGQLKEIYPKKPIYDIPGYPSVLAEELIDSLMEQIKPFKPTFTLGEKAFSVEKQEDESFVITTDEGTQHHAPVVIIAGGLGSFKPRKPIVGDLEHYEQLGCIHYIVKNPQQFQNQNLVISGGGDSALDWLIYLANMAETITLVHRSEVFRAHKDSINKAQELADQGKINLLTSSEVVALSGQGKLEYVTVKGDKQHQIKADHWLPLFGLTPELGPIADWGLEIEKNAIKVDNTLDYQTNIPGIYAVGDVNTYPGKLKLILCGFHEGTLAVQGAYKRIHQGKNFVMKYTTVTGIKGF